MRTGGPSDRIDAARLLALSGDPAGLLQLAGWASDPVTIPPYDAAGSAAHDRYPNADLTFLGFAQALELSFWREDGGAELRAAQRRLAAALLGRLHCELLDPCLADAFAADETFPAELPGELRAATVAAVDTLEAGTRLPFLLEPQTLSVLRHLFAVDVDAGLDQAERLVPFVIQDDLWASVVRHLLVACDGPRARAVLARLDRALVGR